MNSRNSEKWKQNLSAMGDEVEPLESEREIGRSAQRSRAPAVPHHALAREPGDSQEATRTRPRTCDTKHWQLPLTRRSRRWRSLVVCNRRAWRMKVGKQLALIAAGYALAVVGGVAAGVIYDSLIPDDIQQTSGGMVAFADMVVFMLGTGFLSLVPTLFLLKLCAERNPRALLVAELVIAVLGPISWLAVRALASGPNPSNLPRAVALMLGPLIAFGAIPRIVLGPVAIMIEAASLFLIRTRIARALLAGAMLLDLVPLVIFALHLAANYR
jgi:hypothetical protein